LNLRAIRAPALRSVILYLSRGKPVPAAETLPSAEGHAIRLNEAGEIIGITVVSAKWWAERDGRVTVTIPDIAPQSGCLASLDNAQEIIDDLRQDLIKTGRVVNQATQDPGEPR
jgi:uncharacterized protein YuzE